MRGHGPMVGLFNRQSFGKGGLCPHKPRTAKPPVMLSPMISTVPLLMYITRRNEEYVPCASRITVPGVTASMVKLRLTHNALLLHIGPVKGYVPGATRILVALLVSAWTSSLPLRHPQCPRPRHSSGLADAAPGPAPPGSCPSRALPARWWAPSSVEAEWSDAPVQGRGGEHEPWVREQEEDNYE